MKKLTAVLYCLVLTLTLAGAANALPYYEAYSGYQEVWEGETYHFGFDFWYDNHTTNVRDTAPGLRLTSDAAGLFNPADYLSATLFIDFSSVDWPSEKASIRMTAWNGYGNVSDAFNLGSFDFDVDDGSLMTFTHIFSNTELAAFAAWGWGNVTIGARNLFGDNDFAIERVAIQMNGGPAPVPEPATMLLLGTGLIGLAGLGRKKIVK